MAERADRMIEYCIRIAKEFQARMSILQVFVKHNLSTGTANETILREFLSSHGPGNFHVGQGFICDPTQPEMVSKQCDILIYNQNDYPLVYADGSIKVVWPESVRMVIEVKTKFTKKDIESALLNIEAAKQVKKRISGLVFAFTSPKLTTVIKHLQSFSRHIKPEHGPTAILLLDKGIVIHRWWLARSRDLELTPGSDATKYAVRIGKGNKGALAVTFLLFLFFEAVESGIDPALFANMTLDIFDEYMEKGHEDVYIGLPETSPMV